MSTHEHRMPHHSLVQMLAESSSKMMFAQRRLCLLALLQLLRLARVQNLHVWKSSIPGWQSSDACVPEDRRETTLVEGTQKPPRLSSTGQCASTTSKGVLVWLDWRLAPNCNTVAQCMQAWLCDAPARGLTKEQHQDFALRAHTQFEGQWRLQGGTPSSST